MRRTLLVLFALTAGFVLNAQNIDRKMVLVEIATGTWCTYCPGAAMGADDLVENGKSVAIIEYHGGDEYETSNGLNRISYYGVSGYPTAIFDGVLKKEGGDHNNSLYTSYLPKYNQRIDTKTHIDLSMEGSVAGFGYSITATITQDENLNDNTKKVFCVITESEIQQAWQGQTHLNFVQRLMVNGSAGTVVDFSGGDVQDMEFTFTRDMSWNVEHCEAIVFVQDSVTKEILQADKLSLMNIVPEFENDVSIMALNNIPENNSIGYLEPRIEMINLGNQNVTSAEIRYNVNGEEDMVMNWTGDLSTFHSGSFYLDPIEFTLLENNLLTVVISQVNGGDDQNPELNTITQEFGNIVEVTEGPYTLTLRTNDTPEQNSWQLLDEFGDVVQSGGPYDEANQFYSIEIEVPAERGLTGYSFVMYDTGGDGLLKAPSILGFFSLTAGDGTPIATMIKDFGYTSTWPLYVPNSVGIENPVKDNSFEVYPNPVQTVLTVEYTMDSRSEVSVFNTIGQKVMQMPLTSLEGRIELNMSDFESGVYFVNIKSDKESVTRRIIVK